MSAAPSPELNEVLSRLQGVKRSGTGWIAQCPSHPDRTASLSVTDGDDGVVIHCHAHCETRDIIADIGMEWTDLFPEQEKSGWEKVTEYRYTDESGKHLFSKTRWLTPEGRKSFSISHPTPSGYQKGYGPHPHVLYNLKRVAEQAASNGVVILVEGEKDADTLGSRGYVATCNPGGAGKWLPIHSEALSGAQVCVIGDNDRAGKLHVKDVLGSLEQHGVHVKKVLQAPEPYKDVTELIEKGGSFNDLVPWTPPAYDIEDFETELKELKNSPAEYKVKVSRLQRAVQRLTINDIEDRPEVLNWKQWLDENTNDDYDWLVEGLLERRDRVIIVAREGAGKSMIARQLALMLACGIHPFNQFKKIKPLRTTTIDLENPDKIIRRKSRDIMDLAVNISARHNGANFRPEASIVMKPSGVNLLSPKGQAEIEEIIAETEPDILFMGPLYKSFIDPGGRSAEAVATEIAMFFDRMRMTYDCALWLEQHAPLGSEGSREMRPFGSAVWSRWPEFGLTLTAEPTEPGIYNLGSFRGMRDERDFPTRLRRGGSGNFPFVVAND